MCLFPIANSNINGLAYKKGVKFFDCGACPECLRKRANVWALRSVFEAKSHVSNCMITLTYDNFAYDEHGNIIGELPVNRDLKVNQRDVQLFFKRLRKWYSKISDEKIKYICTAEYGKRTHRAHYHVILFGVHFPDMAFYKKSKRGNALYMSKILTKLWSHGICTIDSVHVQSAVARYCTKYCAKSRTDETFMLFSHKVGFDSLLKAFNGKSYFVDGQEYPIPRFVWQYVISRRHAGSPIYFTYKYINKTNDSLDDGTFINNYYQRRNYRIIRDHDPLYINYLSYWQNKASQFESIQLPVRDRILALDNEKFYKYKQAALRVYDFKQAYNMFFPGPGSNCGIAYMYRNYEGLLRSGFFADRHLPFPSRLYKASDTEYPEILENISLRC